MPQLLLPGFPAGAVRVGDVVSVLKKDGRVTYFVGSDNYFSHAEGDAGGERFAIATLVTNRHVRLCEVESSELGIPRRTVQRWLAQLEKRGADSFFAPRRLRGAAVMTPEMVAACGGYLAGGLKVSEVAPGGYWRIDPAQGDPAGRPGGGRIAGSRFSGGRWGGDGQVGA